MGHVTYSSLSCCGALLYHTDSDFHSDSADRTNFCFTFGGPPIRNIAHAFAQKTLNAKKTFHIVFSYHVTYSCFNICSGHSLGGAMASTVALLYRTDSQFQTDSADRTFVYTFGAPRVGNVAFAQTYNQYLPNTYRVVYNRDVIPHLPPSNGLMKHGGLEVRI